MKKYIPCLFIIFSALSVKGQTRQMSIELKHSRHVLWIEENRYVSVKCKNGNRSRGQIAFLNDSQFTINNDTIHLDSIKSFMNIRRGTFEISPETFPLKWDMYVKYKGKKRLHYKIPERHFVKVKSVSGEKYKGIIFFLNDSQFAVKGHTINIHNVVKIKKIAKSTRVLRKIFLLAGPPVASGGLYVLSTVSSSSLSLGNIIVTLIGAAAFAAGTGVTVASGILHLIPIRYRKIDGTRRKLYIKANNKKNPEL